jgi:drug/metabolite transporter (DMT)-like permease
MYLGFLAWYKGLALGGIARVSQIQLAQPVLSLVWAWLFLNESIGWEEIGAGLLVIGSVILTRRYRFQSSAGMEARPADGLALVDQAG